MSTPSTKRDQRRDTRRAQFLQRQEDRRQVRERALRVRRIRQGGFIGGGILLAVVLIWAIVAFATTPPSHPHSPATGNTVDGIQCTTGETLTVHYHAYLQIYVNGQPQAIPAGIGIVEPDSAQAGPHLASNGTTACLYALHTHDASGVIHVEAPGNDTYTLGQVFDLWGQSLSKTQIMDNKVDGSHKLVVEEFDATGKMIRVSDNPADIQLSSHESIYLLYNSPSVQVKPFDQWQQMNLPQ